MPCFGCGFHGGVGSSEGRQVIGDWRVVGDGCCDERSGLPDGLYVIMGLVEAERLVMQPER